MTEKQYYDDLAAHLTKTSGEICAENECDGENHNCETFAYFDKTGDLWTLETVCLPDYCQRSYDSCVPLPFDGDGTTLLEEIELYERDLA